MGRDPDTVPTNPLDIISQYGKYYILKKKYNQLMFFSKYKQHCERLLLFGGAIYRHKMGYSWVLTKQSQLIIIYKMLGDTPCNPDVERFKENMQKITE